MFSKTALMVGTVMTFAVAGPVYAGSTTTADQTNTMATDDAVKSDANKMGDKVAAQYEEAKDFTFEQKEDFLAWVNEKSSELGSNYEDVSEQVKQDSSEAYEDLANAWDGATNELGEAVDDVQDASSDTWENVKKNTVMALENAQEALSDGQATE